MPRPAKRKTKHEPLGTDAKPKAAPRLRSANEEITYHPLTPDRWPDLERLFGERGACGGCWCMYWRRARSDYERGKGDANRRAFQQLVKSGEEPGILAYVGAEPIGWCAVAPREQYVRLTMSRILQPVDDRVVWAVTCLFIARGRRRGGVSVGLLRAAADFVRQRGGRIIEGYPIDPRQRQLGDSFAWTGISSAFEKAGFREVLRRSPGRPIMRRTLRA